VRFTTTVLIAAVLLAGCGSSSGGTSTTVTRAAITPAEPAAAPTLPRACAPHAQRAVGATRAAGYKASNGADGCRLRAADLEAVVLLDSAPQPYFRLDREVTEFGQNVDWTKVPPSAYPRTIKHLGLESDWFPLQSRLLTTDGVRLTTVKIRAPAMSAPERRAAAIRLARVYLGPLHKPPGY
jgi:hypothetical protein